MIYISTHTESLSYSSLLSKFWAANKLAEYFTLWTPHFLDIGRDVSFILIRPIDPMPKKTTKEAKHHIPLIDEAITIYCAIFI